VPCGGYSAMVLNMGFSLSVCKNYIIYNSLSPEDREEDMAW